MQTDGKTRKKESPRVDPKNGHKFPQNKIKPALSIQYKMIKQTQKKKNEKTIKAEIGGRVEIVETLFNTNYFNDEDQVFLMIITTP